MCVCTRACVHMHTHTDTRKEIWVIQCFLYHISNIFVVFVCFSLIKCFFFSIDVFLPTPDSLLVNLHESKEVRLIKKVLLSSKK